jgi:hypothetical protein
LSIKARFQKGTSKNIFQKAGIFFGGRKYPSDTTIHHKSATLLPSGKLKDRNPLQKRTFARGKKNSANP